MHLFEAWLPLFVFISVRIRYECQYPHIVMSSVVYCLTCGNVCPSPTQLHQSLSYQYCECRLMCVLCIVDMQLVVVCCREMEDRCHIINALDRYRVKVPPVDKSDVNYYLKQHFTVANVAGQGTAMRAASSLDPERLLQDRYCISVFSLV